MGIFSSDTQTATATEGSGGGGSGGVFGSAITGFFKAHPELLQSQNTSGATSEDAPGNAINKRKGGKITASSRADGIAQRGKTRGKIV